MKVEIVEAGDWYHVTVNRLRVAMCRTQADAALVAAAIEGMEAFVAAPLSSEVPACKCPPCNRMAAALATYVDARDRRPA